MKINIGYVVDESNRRQGVHIPYAEWKQLKQRLLDAEMQFWEIQKLEAIIRQTDLLAIIPEVQAIEAGRTPALTLANAFTSDSDAVQLKLNPQILVLPSFVEKVNLLIAKHPLLATELLKLGQAQLGGFASIVAQDYLAFGWSIVRKKHKSQPAMRLELHFLHKRGQPDAVSKEPLYLAIIYDKSDQKLMQPEPLELV